MKIQIGLDLGTYTFNPATRQITLSNMLTASGQAISVDLEDVTLIVNATDNIILYNFADPTLGASIASNVITLNYDTSSMALTDRLLILISIVDPIEDLLRMINRMIKQSESLGNMDAANRLRVAVDSFTAALTITTVTTLTTITNPVPVGDVATLGGLSPKFQMIDTARMAYELGIRSKLVWS